MEMNALFFYLFAGLAIAFSLMVILLKNPVSSAFSLVLVFFCFAALYALMQVHLIATLQVLVYAGAIMVLFVFVIMLLNADQPVFDLQKTPLWIKAAATLGGFSLLILLVSVFKGGDSLAPTAQYTLENVERAGGNTQVLSELLFSEYLLPFEVTSILLLVSIVATVALAKRKLDRGSV